MVRVLEKILKSSDPDERGDDCESWDDALDDIYHDTRDALTQHYLEFYAD